VTLIENADANSIAGHRRIEAAAELRAVDRMDDTETRLDERAIRIWSP